MKWLTRLKSEKGLSLEVPKLPKAQIQPKEEPPTPPEVPFDSFGSTEESRFPEFAPPPPMPYLDESGDLVISFGSDPKYHWWSGGQSVDETIKEIAEGQKGSRVPLRI